MKVFNLFPLTVLQNKINITEDERTILVNEIKKMQSQKVEISKSSYAWTSQFYIQIKLFRVCFYRWS